MLAVPLASTLQDRAPLDPGLGRTPEALRAQVAALLDRAAEARRSARAAADARGHDRLLAEADGLRRAATDAAASLGLLLVVARTHPRPDPQ